MSTGALLSAKERAYLEAHTLGHLATIGPGGPHVVPLGYRLNADESIDIGGPKLATSRKYRDVQSDGRVAFVVDDMTPPDEPDFQPSVGRGIELRGRAEALVDEDPPDFGPPGFFSREVIRVHPERAISWHIDADQPGLRVLSGGRIS